MQRSVLAHPSLVQRLVALADRLVKLHRPVEAAEALELAAALSPRGDELLERAARLRRLEPTDALEREMKRRNLEASHAIGMGHVLASRGETERAAELYDLAKLRTPYHYLAYAASGYLLLRTGDQEGALAEFTQARRLNPLDLRLAVEAARAAVATERYEEGLEHAVDAMLLAQWEGNGQREPARRRVETLARLCRLEPEELDRRVRERGRALQKAADHVALSRARLFAGTRWRRRPPAPRRQPARGDLLDKAAELRAMGVLRHVTDEQLVELARLAEVRAFDHAEVIFREGESSRDLYLVRSGAVHVTRQTPAGTQVLTTCGPGTLFGEVAYLDHGPRSATAFGVGSGQLYRIPAGALDELSGRDRDLAVALLWSFWHSLADKVRAANAQMDELLELARPETARRPSSGGRRVQLSEAEKLELLREQGLTAQELRLLATYSHERRFEGGDLIFAEGERGDELYIVVDGRVRISRLVPGGGEESLSILGRGEVFGEMALIDDMPRSADARAHTGGCTVFTVSRTLLEEVLSMDPDAAVQFLGLLSRLLCRRLRAMNDRLVAWRVMAAHE